MLVPAYIPMLCDPIYIFRACGESYVGRGWLENVLDVNISGLLGTPAATSRRATPLILLSKARNTSIVSMLVSVLANADNCFSASFLIRHLYLIESTMTVKSMPSLVLRGAD